MPYSGLVTILLQIFPKSQMLCDQNGNIALIVVKVGIWPGNFVGTLLVSILIDPDHFPLDSECFEKMFIFVHFAHSMNHTVFIVLVVADMI